MLSLESEQVPIAFAVVEGGGGPGGRVAISVGRPEIPVGTGQPVLTEAPGQMNEGLVEGSSPRVSSILPACPHPISKRRKRLPTVLVSA